MSQFFYAGIALPYSQTSGFDQSAVLDESNVDFLYTRFDVRYMGVIHAAYLKAIAPTCPSTGNPAEIVDFIRSRLLKPRQKLSILFNGQDVIPNLPLTGTTGNNYVDARNGPTPQSCVVTQLTNTSWLLTFHVVAHFVENNNSAFNINTGKHSNPAFENQWAGNPCLSNRWSENQEIGEDGMSKYVREGRFHIRSDASEGKTVDFYRPMFANIALERGYVRESANYTVSPDGLSLAYRIVDKEMFKMPPPPAYMARGRYFMAAPQNNAVRRIGLHLWLKGAKSVPQDQLISTASAVAMAKMNANVAVIGARGVDPGIPLAPRPIELGRSFQTYSFRLSVDMYENVVEVDHEAMVVAGSGRLNYMAILDRGAQATTNLTYTPGSDGVDYTPTYPVRGATFQAVGNNPAPQACGGYPMILSAAAYFDPSLQQTFNGWNWTPRNQVGVEGAEVNTGAGI